MTVYAEHGAKSRADLPPGTRFGTHFLVLDEFHDFVSQSAAQLTSMLSETRKFNLFAVLSHQTLDQVPDRMRSGLQNVEVDITFRTGRDDAEQQAKVVGSVDPFSVKHEVAEHQERSHPTFFPLQEQWEGWTQELTKLKKRVAFIRDPSGSVTKVQSLDMPDPVVDPGRLAAIEARYLNECFYSAGFHQPDASIPLFAAEPPFVPVVELAA
jgi:hypothetical protein